MQALPTKIVPFYWQFLKRRKGYVVASLLLTAVFSFRESLNPLFIRMIVDGINAASAAGWQPAPGHWVPWAVLLPILLYIGIQLVNEWGQLAVEILEHKNLPKLKKEIRAALFDHVQDHAPQYFQDNFAGSIANRIGLMGPATDALLRLWMQSMFKPIFSLLTILVLLVSASPLYGVIMVAWLVAYYASVIFLAPGVSRRSRAYAKAQTVTNGHIVDVVSNAASMKYYARSDYEQSRLEHAIDEEITAERKQRRKLLAQSALQKNLTNLIVLCMMLAATYGWTQGRVTPGEFAMVLMLSLQLGYRAYEIGSAIVMYFNEAGRVSEALELIAVPHALSDAPDAQPIRVTTGDIRIEKLNFAYKAESPLFESFNLHIPAGQKIGLVGLSGSGKTTLVNLILRFFNPQSGRILIDGQDIDLIQQESLRAQIAFVPQDTALFHRTLRDNIRYGRLDASDDDVVAATRQAHAQDFIASLPEGYDTYVGERGVKLSGGQRQRIAIARAAIKNAPILMLDEATSALDSESERHVQTALAELMHDKTVIAIAHRLSTIARLDRLIVLNHGRIVEDGKHADLITRDGPYARLWRMQSGGMLDDLHTG